MRFAQVLCLLAGAVLLVWGASRGLGPRVFPVDELPPDYLGPVRVAGRLEEAGGALRLVGPGGVSLALVWDGPGGLPRSMVGSRVVALGVLERGGEGDRVLRVERLFRKCPARYTAADDTG